MADAGDDERLDLLADIGASLACTCQDLEDATPNFSDPGLTDANQQTCQRPRPSQLMNLFSKEPVQGKDVVYCWGAQSGHGFVD